jgi:hypothetical protein
MSLVENRKAASSKSSAAPVPKPAERAAGKPGLPKLKADLKRGARKAIAEETTSIKLADDLDLPIWGAKAIARAAGLFRDDGSADTRKAFYKLEAGYIDADKNGGEWVTTKRRILGGLHNPAEPKSGK